MPLIVNISFQATLLHYIYNDDGPICGAAFLNYVCTEFCTVTVDSTKVKFYIRWDNKQKEEDNESEAN